jgi:hypothetical protein
MRSGGRFIGGGGVRNLLRFLSLQEVELGLGSQHVVNLGFLSLDSGLERGLDVG